MIPKIPLAARLIYASSASNVRLAIKNTCNNQSNFHLPCIATTDPLLTDANAKPFLELPW